MVHDLPRSRREDLQEACLLTELEKRSSVVHTLFFCYREQNPGRWPIIRSSQVPNRIELLKYVDIAGKDCAEIGVHVAEFSSAIYALQPRSLLLVDPWKYCDENKNLVMNTSQRDYDQRYEGVCRTFGDKPNVTILREFSVDAALQVRDESLDVVYVDGNHDFLYVLADLFVWFPKLRKGGWMAGHDNCNRFPGVTRAYRLFVGIVGADEIVESREYFASFAIKKRGS